MRNLYKIFSLTFIEIICFGIISYGNSADDKINKRAEEFLSAIRTENWEACTSYIIVITEKHDKYTRMRMGISENADQEEIKEKIISFFKGLYEKVKPGKIMSIKINPKDKKLVLISYRHGDLDGFYMREVDDEWYYTIDSKPIDF